MFERTSCFHFSKAVFHFSSIVFQYGFEPTPPPTPEEEESEEEQDEDEDGLTGGEMMVLVVDCWSRTRNNEEYNSFYQGAGAIDPTDPAAAAASKMQNLVSFLIQVDLASTYMFVYLLFVAPPREPSP